MGDEDENAGAAAVKFNRNIGFVLDGGGVGNVTPWRIVSDNNEMIVGRKAGRGGALTNGLYFDGETHVTLDSGQAANNLTLRSGQRGATVGYAEARMLGSGYQAQLRARKVNLQGADLHVGVGVTPVQSLVTAPSSGDATYVRYFHESDTRFTMASGPTTSVFEWIGAPDQGDFAVGVQNAPYGQPIANPMPLFQVRTNGTWKRLGADLHEEPLSGGHANSKKIILRDSNEEDISSIDILIPNVTFTWGDDGELSQADNDFQGISGVPHNKNKFIFVNDSKITNASVNAGWDELGVLVVDGGAATPFTAVPTNQQIPRKDITGDPTNTPANDMVVELCGAISALINSHNNLVDKLRDMEYNRAHMAGAIWGSEGTNATGTSVKFDRNVNMFNATGGGDASKWKFLSTETDMTLGRRSNNSGLYLANVGLTTLTSGVAGQSVIAASG